MCLAERGKQSRPISRAMHVSGWQGQLRHGPLYAPRGRNCHGKRKQSVAAADVVDGSRNVHMGPLRLDAPRNGG